MLLLVLLFTELLLVATAGFVLKVRAREERHGEKLNENYQQNALRSFARFVGGW